MAIISLPVPVSPSSSTVARLLATWPTVANTSCMAGAVADDVVEAVLAAQVVLELLVLRQPLIVLELHEVVDADGLGEGAGDDLQQPGVGLKLLFALERLIDAERRRRTARRH